MNAVEATLLGRALRDFQGRGWRESMCSPASENCGRTAPMFRILMRVEGGEWSARGKTPLGLAKICPARQASDFRQNNKCQGPAAHSVAGRRFMQFRQQCARGRKAVSASEKRVLGLIYRGFIGTYQRNSCENFGNVTISKISRPNFSGSGGDARGSLSSGAFGMSLSGFLGPRWDVVGGGGANQEADSGPDSTCLDQVTFEN
ncbi:hypothetical protein DFH09DRAFT_1279787 [Mycena vulgaris]|nr:hypothetical protein DFH09DRAFT_1279787 [Mycena vulgaris]